MPTTTGKIPLDGPSGLSYTLHAPGDSSSPLPENQILVVFINGLLTTSEDWAPISTSLTIHPLSTLSYDRWNRGLSDPLPPTHPHNDIATSATDLAILLRSPALPRYSSILLVGSSIGCSIIRIFLQQQPQPQPIRGVLFLDPYFSSTDFTSLFPAPVAGEPEPLTRTRKIVSALLHPSVPNAEGLDRGNAATLLQFADVPKFREELVMEGGLVVVGHDMEYTADDMQEKMGLDKECWLRYVDSEWREHQRALATLWPAGRFMVADRAGHFVHRDRPDLVLEVVLEMCGVRVADGAGGTV